MLMKPPNPGDHFMARGSIRVTVHAKLFDEYPYAEAIAKKDFEMCIAKLKETASAFAVRLEIDLGTIYLDRAEGVK